MREVVSKSGKLWENCNFLLYPSFRAQHKVQRAQHRAKEKSYKTSNTRTFFHLLMLIITYRVWALNKRLITNIQRQRGNFQHMIPIGSQMSRVFVVVS